MLMPTKAVIKIRGDYLIGAGNSDVKERYKGTIAFWDSFKLLARKYGFSEIDLEGMNSPQRGEFKLSFGGNIKPYFELSLRKQT